MWTEFVSNPSFRKQRIAKLFLSLWQAPIPGWEATKKECCKSILPRHLHFPFSLRKKASNEIKYCFCVSPLTCQDKWKTWNCILLITMGPPWVFPCLPPLFPPSSISLGSIFRTHSCLLHSSDYLFCLCRNPTWKGMKPDLSHHIDTLLFTFGIWTQQNETKHILTASPQ